MYFTKKIQIITVAVLMLIIVVFSAPVQLFAEDTAGPSNFMDMETYVKQLVSKVKMVRKSIVHVVAYDSSGLMRSGTGFFIDYEGRIITNALILNNAYSAEVFSESHHYKNVRLLNMDNSVDIALLQVDAVGEKPVDIDYEYEAREGDRVTVIGKPSAFNMALSEGLISNVISIDEEIEYIEVAATQGLIKYGLTKNGPVIDREGRVVGMVTKNMPELRHENFVRVFHGDTLPALSIDPVKDLVSGPYINKQFQPPGAKIWSRWFIRHLKESIVSTFLSLYYMGFVKMISLVAKLILFALVVMWILNKFNIIKLHK